MEFTNGKGNLRLLFPEMAGNMNSRSPLLWKALGQSGAQFVTLKEKIIGSQTVSGPKFPKTICDISINRQIAVLHPFQMEFFILSEQFVKISGFPASLSGFLVDGPPVDKRERTRSTFFLII